jgi:hypothetical protein
VTQYIESRTYRHSGCKGISSAPPVFEELSAVIWWKGIANEANSIYYVRESCVGAVVVGRCAANRSVDMMQVKNT